MSSAAAHTESGQVVEMGDALLPVLAASRYNRDLHRLVRLTDPRARLDTFADRDPMCELMNALLTRGVSRSAAGREVVAFMSAADGPREAHKVAISLVWVLQAAADALDGMAVGTGG